MRIGQKSKPLAACIFVGVIVSQAFAVILTGYEKNFDFRIAGDREQITWSPGWRFGPDGASCQAANAWLETHPLAMGDGIRLGSGFAGPVVVKLTKAFDAESSMALRFRTKDFDGQWSEWSEAKRVTASVINSETSTPLATNEIAFEVRGAFGGPSTEWFREQYLRAGYEGTGTGMRKKGSDTTPALYSHLRFASGSEPPIAKPEGAGYMQVRVSAQGNVGAIERIRFELGGIISGLKP